MKLVAPDVWLIRLPPANLINVYLIGDVLVDAGMSFHASAILEHLRAADVTVAKHVATHAHLDHVGGMRALSAATGAPVFIGTTDKPFADSGESPHPPALNLPGVSTLVRRGVRFDPFAVRQTLHEGDAIGYGFVVIDTPGHTPGHLSLWRAEDATLIAGDVYAGRSLISGRPGLYEPPGFFSVDAQANRNSARALADLNPATVCFGHGPPLHDASDPLRAFAANLPTAA